MNGDADTKTPNETENDAKAGGDTCSKGKKDENGSTTLKSSKLGPDTSENWTHTSVDSKVNGTEATKAEESAENSEEEGEEKEVWQTYDSMLLMFDIEAADLIPLIIK